MVLYQTDLTLKDIVDTTQDKALARCRGQCMAGEEQPARGLACFCSIPFLAPHYHPLVDCYTFVHLHKERHRKGKIHGRVGEQEDEAETASFV